MSKYVVKTLGCKANWYDGQLLESKLQDLGWRQSENSGDAELCIVNSCTVTDEADKQSRQLAKRLAREYPRAKVVFTGCGAEVAPEEFAQSPGVSFVVGNQDKNQLVDLVLGADPAAPESPTSSKILGSVSSYGELLSRHPMDREWTLPESTFMLPSLAQDSQTERTRAFVKIQEGCDSFCTYCIIPYGRGPSRSLSTDLLLQQVSALANSGVREVILTGTNIGEYGVDQTASGKSTLTFLLREIFEKTRIERLRVSSLDPVEIEPEILELMTTEPRFCPHFHVSLQSPHPKILKLMKRKYSAQQAEESLLRIASLRPAAAPHTRPFVGMDVITGFPGETEQDFRETWDQLSVLPWDRLHVFPYSERKGTPATRIKPSVPLMERKKRAQLLQQLSFDRLHQRYQGALQQVQQRVLIEGSTRGPDHTDHWWGGYTPDYIRVLIKKSHQSADALDLRENQVISVSPQELFLNRSAGDITLIGIPIFE